MSTATLKTVEVIFENALETYEKQTQLIDLCSFEQPDPAKLQNAGDVIWRPVQQHAPIIDGFDVSGQETGIIEEGYPAILGTPKNDIVRQRIDKMRDMQFWKRRGIESGKQQATELNSAIASAVALQGSLFYRSNVTSGYEFISEAQAQMNERQLYNSERCFILNDRDTKLFSADLAGRQTLQGQPDATWKTGMLGNNIAGFDGVYTGSFLPNLVGGADPATTVTGNQSFGPLGGTVVTSTGVVTNNDYRIASIPVAASGSYNVGDKVTFANAGTTVKALGLASKDSTDQAMVFSIVGKPDATTIQVYPKPIAADDAALSDLEKAYANIDTVILNAATVNRVNTDASNKTNLFWDKSAVEVLGGALPANLFAELAGKKVVQETLSNGLEMYMVYDGDIMRADFTFRLLTWYGITIANPSNCGVAVTF